MLLPPSSARNAHAAALAYGQKQGPWDGRRRRGHRRKLLRRLRLRLWRLRLRFQRLRLRLRRQRRRHLGRGRSRGRGRRRRRMRRRRRWRGCCCGRRRRKQRSGWRRRCGRVRSRRRRRRRRRRRSRSGSRWFSEAASASGATGKLTKTRRRQTQKRGRGYGQHRQLSQCQRAFFNITKSRGMNQKQRTTLTSESRGMLHHKQGWYQTQGFKLIQNYTPCHYLTSGLLGHSKTAPGPIPDGLIFSPACDEACSRHRTRTTTTTVVEEVSRAVLGPRTYQL